MKSPINEDETLVLGSFCMQCVLSMKLKVCKEGGQFDGGMMVQQVNHPFIQAIF